MFLIHLPDGINVYGARGGEFEGVESDRGLTAVKPDTFYSLVQTLLL